MSEDRTIIARRQPSVIIEPGTRLNGIFEIERQIGSGGMGRVYRARNVDTGDAVAVKVVRAEMASNPQVIALFRKEAAVLNKLLHDAIVRYYLLTTDPVIDLPYLVTEFVDGIPLSDVIEKKPLPREQVLLLGERLADGLGSAHKMDIVHRDISPDNILMPDGDVRRAKIIDFGIARATKLGVGTMIGDSIAGKFDYMSPEQVGLHGQVDARSDIYSLGIVLAEAYLGRGLGMGGTQYEVLKKRQEDPDLSKIEPKLRAVIAAMMRPKPEDRLQSMADVAARLRALSATRPLTDKKKRPPVVPLAAGVLLAAAIGGGAYLYGQSGNGGGREGGDGDVGPPPLTKRDTVTSRADADLDELPSETAAREQATGRITTVDNREQTTTVPPPDTPVAPPTPAPSTPSPTGTTTPTEPTPPAPTPTPTETATPPAPTNTTTTPPTPSTPTPPTPRDDPDQDVARNRTETGPTAPTPAPTPGLEELEGRETPPGDTIDPTRPREGEQDIAIERPRPDPVRPGEDPDGPTENVIRPGEEDPVRPPPGENLEEIDKDSPLQPVGIPGAGILRYVRQYDPGDCALLRIASYGPDRAAVVGYGLSPDPFNQFDADFTQSFGFEAQINVSMVTPEQCPIIDFLRRVGPGNESTLRMQLDNETVQPGGVLSGAITGLESRDVAILLVDADGQVYGVNQLVSRGRDEATVHINIAMQDEADRGTRPQLLVAVAGSNVPPLGTRPIDARTAVAQLNKALADSGTLETAIGHYLFGR